MYVLNYVLWMNPNPQSNIYQFQYYSTQETMLNFLLTLFLLLPFFRLSMCDDVDVLMNLLFPNRTHSKNRGSRSLLGYHPKPATPVPCIICQRLTVCQSLNKLLVQEKYYPNNLDLLGTCFVIEDLAKRVESEIFGNGKTFRDTSLCRDIVMQYLCLFWGSDNEMYTNLCIFQESVSSPDPANHIITPRPPCRSFCVQVADICANDPNFINLCYNIACPPTEDECTPGNIVHPPLHFLSAFLLYCF
jgi:hypothetical protein